MKLGNKKGVFVFLGAVVIFGCTQKDDFNIPYNVLEIENREAVSAEGFPVRTIDEMEPTDIIVAVNGYPLRKSVFDVFLKLKARDIMGRRGMNSMMAEKLLDQFRRGFVKTFIAQRLLVDNAIDLGIVSTNSVNEYVGSYVLETARKRKKQVSSILLKSEIENRCYFYELGINFAMNELIKTKIPPKEVVNEEFVKKVKDQIRYDNIAAGETNRQIKVQMMDLKRQILTNKLDFAKAAKCFSEHSELLPDAGEAGDWGYFEESDFDDKTVAAAVFSLSKGVISDVIEDDNGYHLVKVVEILPPATDESGVVIKGETRRLQHIYREKVPLLIEQTDIQLNYDLKNQMQLLAVNEYVQGLSTNPANKIVFPHGSQLFK